MFNSGWAKLNKYYTTTDETPAYVAALVLNPRWKWGYIEKHWEKAWLPKSKKLLEELWEIYRPHTVTPTLQSRPKTTNEYLLFLEEQDVSEEVLDDELESSFTIPVRGGWSLLSRICIQICPS